MGDITSDLGDITSDMGDITSDKGDVTSDIFLQYFSRRVLKRGDRQSLKHVLKTT